MAFPTEAAYSGGSSETLERWILGTTSVCPGRSGRISANGARLLGLLRPGKAVLVKKEPTEKSYDLVVLVYSIGGCCIADDLAESAFSV
jgi:hypothetical protein